MRILHVISTLAPASGGPTEVLRGLAAAQVDAGHQVTICTTDRGNPVRERLSASYFRDFCRGDVTVRAFPVTHVPSLLSLSLAWWLKDNVKDFDVVDIHGLYRFPPSYAAYQARRQNVTYVIRPHGALDPFLYKKSTYSVWLKRLYERLFDLRNLNHADAIHYTADEERERVSFLRLRAPSFVVPNGLAWDRYRILPEKGMLRTAWRLSNAPIVLFLGRIHPKKGLDLLIPAFDALRRQIPDAQLVIAGPENDGYGQSVRRWVRELGLTESVHFVGPLSGPDVVQAYVDADVFALPSYTENFGMTVVEAMACGIPVVISDQVNIHGEVAQAGGGLVTRCDSDEIANALISLLLDPGRRYAMGQAGRALVERRYVLRVIVHALTAEYQAAIQHRNCKIRRRGRAA